MMGLWETIIYVFLLGIFLAAIARANHYRFNPNEIEKDETGKVKWAWMCFVNMVALLIGGLVSVAAFFMLKNFGMDTNGYEIAFVSGIFAIAGDRIFIMAQEKLNKKAEDAFENVGL